MTRTRATRSLRSTGRRLAGAVSAAAAVGLVGTAALPAATAAAAGVADDHPRPLPTRSDPADLPAPSGVTTVAYRWSGGRWQRV